MAFTTNAVFRIWAGSATNNGCGWDASLGGSTDYTKQASPQYTPTSVLSTTGVVTLVSYAAAAADMLGNSIYITGGTNFTVGLYFITAVNAGVSITLDRAATTAAGSSGSGRIGGAQGDLSVIGASTASSAIAGNRIYATGSFSGFGASFTISCTGTTTNPISVIGYKTLDTDGYQGRAANGGALVSTNMASFALSTFRINVTAGAITFANCNFGSTVNGQLINHSGGNSVFSNCIINNASTGGSAEAISLSQGLIWNCDLTMSGASGGLDVVSLVQSQSNVIGCRITTTAGTCPGISVTSGTYTISDNLIYNCSNGIVAGGNGSILNNTIVSNTSNGISINAAAVSVNIINNMITDNTGFGVNANTSASVAGWNNRFRNNTGGNLSTGSGWNTNAILGSIIGTGASSIDYNSPGTGDYTLKATSPAVNAGLPFSQSCGAFQVQYAPSGGGNFGRMRSGVRMQS